MREEKSRKGEAGRGCEIEKRSRRRIKSQLGEMDKQVESQKREGYEETSMKFRKRWRRKSNSKPPSSY